MFQRELFSPCRITALFTLWLPTFWRELHSTRIETRGNYQSVRLKALKSRLLGIKNNETHRSCQPKSNCPNCERSAIVALEWQFVGPGHGRCSILTFSRRSWYHYSKKATRSVALQHSSARLRHRQRDATAMHHRCLAEGNRLLYWRNGYPGQLRRLEMSERNSPSRHWESIATCQSRLGHCIRTDDSHGRRAGRLRQTSLLLKGWSRWRVCACWVSFANRTLSKPERERLTAGTGRRPVFFNFNIRGTQVYKDMAQGALPKLWKPADARSFPGKHDVQSRWIVRQYPILFLSNFADSRAVIRNCKC